MKNEVSEIRIDDCHLLYVKKIGETHVQVEIVENELHEDVYIIKHSFLICL